MEAASFSEVGTDAVLGHSQFCFLLVEEYCSRGVKLVLKDVKLIGGW